MLISDKICPIRWAGGRIDANNRARDKEEVICQREKCEWWIQEVESCAVPTLYYQIKSVNTKLKEPE